MQATASAPASIHSRSFRLLAYAIPLVCLLVFIVSQHNKLIGGALADCETLYTAPGFEGGCARWRAAFTQVGLTPLAFELYFLVLRVVSAVPFFALSLLLLRRYAGSRRVVLLVCLLGLLGIAGPVYNPFWEWMTDPYVSADRFPLQVTVQRALNYSLSIGAVLFTLLFPSGHFVPRWTRWLALAWALLRFGVVFLGDTPASVFNWPEPLGLVIVSTIQFVAVGAFIWRYRFQANAVERQQIKWIFAGSLLVALNYFVDYGVWEIYPALTGTHLVATEQQGIYWELGQDTLWYVSQFVFGVCVGLSIFRHRLWDIDLILSRTLVYGTLTGLIVGLYILIVGGLGALFHTPANAVSGLAATGIVAIVFQPLRERLHRVVSRLLYGERDDPAAVLTRLALQIEAANETRLDILPTLAQTIARTLKIPHVVIWLVTPEGGTVRGAEWGDAQSENERVPLVYQNTEIGYLSVARRGPQEKFSQQEQRLLNAIAALTATAVRAVQLSDDLVRSRQQIVTAREEERRRLRRDLHDGLGPSLASLPLKIDAAMDLIEQDRQASVDLLQQVKTQSQAMVADVRRVVHDLRPPALDELGLTEALRGALAQMRPAPHELAITFDADALGVLPAAIEAAAYRVTMEAVTNVIKHAHARHCRATLRRLTTPARLEIAVEDDGVGLSQGVVANVGLRSMRERAEELGGTFEISPRPAGGTRISVTLPLPKEEDP